MNTKHTDRNSRTEFNANRSLAERAAMRDGAQAAAARLKAQAERNEIIRRLGA
jgi:hypothetical protein